MGRSHKKSGGGGGGGGSSAKKKNAKAKRKLAHQQPTEEEQQSHADGHVPGWRQQDYQQRAQRLAEQQQRQQQGEAEADEAECAAASAPSSGPRARSGSRKKRQHTPAWMIDPNEVALSASSSGAQADAACSSAAPSLSSACWNNFPRDCLLHVFSFFDLHAIARLTGTSRFWHAALCRGVLARVLEQSWRILRQRKQPTMALMPTPPPPPSRQTTEECAWADEDGETEPAPALVRPVPVAPLRSISHVISPLEPAVMSLDSSDIAAAALPPPAAPSPSLSSLPPAAALKAISTSTLSLSSSAAPTAQSVCVAGAPFSSSSTLFRASLLHLRSLYFGQKQLAYSLASNPLFQNLSVMHHLSACHERVLHTLRHVHVALYRGAHAGKWPRSTKVDENVLLAAASLRPDDRPPSAANDTFDLMPLHFNLDAAGHHRTALLTQLQRSQKQIWEFLHSTPVIVHFGFDGSSLAGIQLERVRSRVEERLQAQLRAPRVDTQRGRYKGAGKAHAAAADFDAVVRDPKTDEVVLDQAQDLPAQLLPPSSPSALVTAAEAELVDATLRRMAKLAHIWGVYLHSTVAQHMHDAAAAAQAQAEADASAMAPTHAQSDASASSSAAAAAAATTPLKTASSSIEREWDSCALLWRAQHARLQRLHAFWHSLGRLLQQCERATLMADIVALPSTAAAGASTTAVQATSASASASASGAEALVDRESS